MLITIDLVGELQMYSIQSDENANHDDIETNLNRFLLESSP